MQGPLETHKAALAARKSNADALEAKARAIGNGRLIAALGAIGLIIAIVFVHLPREAWFGVLGCVLAFGALVLVHARVHAVRDLHAVGR